MVQLNGSKRLEKIRVKGKFLYRDNSKIFIRGVTYGTFAPNKKGKQLVRWYGKKKIEKFLERLPVPGNYCQVLNIRNSVFFIYNRHTAIIAGSGGWCGPYTDLPEFLPIIERRFKKVIVFPSSYDTTINKVREAVERSDAFFFAKEEVSYNLIKNICHAVLAHDTAFFYDYNSCQRKGTGQLDAFRTDKEAAGLLIPTDNDDISLTCESLDEWLWKISSYEKICTDRAHVMIAAALLGKQVDYRSSSYHKVPAIAEFSLKDFPVKK